MIAKAITTSLLCTALFLGSYRGYLALFQKDAREPIQVFPCRVEMLPEADQEKLTKRIRIRDEAALEQLLEDYLS